MPAALSLVTFEVQDFQEQSVSLKEMKTNIPLPCSGQDSLSPWRDDLRKGNDNHHSTLSPEIWKHTVHFISLNFLWTQLVPHGHINTLLLEIFMFEHKGEQSKPVIKSHQHLV